MRAIAVLAAYAVAYFGGGLLVPYLREWLQIPDMVISGVGGAILAVVVYGLLSSLGTLLFKRTAQQAIRQLVLFTASVERSLESVLVSFSSG